MNDVIPLAFEDNLIRTVVRKDEPWFVGNDVCAALGIQKARTSLDRLDDDEKGAHSVGTPGGLQTVTIISEPGCYRLIFTSRKPEAERFKRWLAHEVLPELRKRGTYTVPGRDLGTLPPDLDSSPASASALKISLVREARLIFGARRAGELWGELGLPAVPFARVEGEEEARHCLSYLLQLPAAEETRWTHLYNMVDDALTNDSTEAEMTLARHGLRVERGVDGEGGFVIANRTPATRDMFADTPFAEGRHVHVLRRLPGTRAVGAQRYDGGFTSRGTFIPARYLDIWGHGQSSG